jgi:hypothetical protein
VLLDGHKVNYWASLFGVVERAWREVGGGTMHGVKTVLLAREDSHTLREVIYWLSYLAKARGKGYKAEQAKNYGASRIPLKDKPK